MKYSYVVTAALLGVLFPVNYLCYLIIVQGYAHLVEPNPIIIWFEVAIMGALTILTIAKLLGEMKDAVRKR